MKLEKKTQKKTQKQDKIFNGLYNIFYINKPLTQQCLNVYFFDFERVISLYENRTAF